MIEFEQLKALADGIRKNAICDCSPTADLYTGFNQGLDALLRAVILAGHGSDSTQN